MTPPRRLAARVSGIVFEEIVHEGLGLAGMLTGLVFRIGVVTGKVLADELARELSDPDSVTRHAARTSMRGIGSGVAVLARRAKRLIPGCMGGLLTEPFCVGEEVIRVGNREWVDVDLYEDCEDEGNDEDWVKV